MKPYWMTRLSRWYKDMLCSLDLHDWDYVKGVRQSILRRVCQRCGTTNWSAR